MLGSTCASIGILLLAATPAAAQSNFKVGNFGKTQAASPATQVVTHNLGVTPKALIIWTGGGVTIDYNFAMGLSDGTTSKSTAAASRDNRSNTQSGSILTDKAVSLLEWDGSVLAESDLVSWDATTFTLNWTTNDGISSSMHYIVIGGNDVSAKVTEWNMPSTAGQVVVNSVGFEADVVLHTFARDTAGGVDGIFGLGVMDRHGGQWANTFHSVDGATESDTQRSQTTSACIRAIDTVLGVQREGSWVAMTPSGFTIQFTDAPGWALPVASLALKGVSAQAGSFAKSVNTAVPVGQSIGGASFEPRLVLFSSYQGLAQAGPLAHTRYGLGAGDGLTEGASAVTDEDALTQSNVHSRDTSAKAFVKVDNLDGFVDAEADLASLDADGFTLNWTTNDDVPTEIQYLALGPAQADTFQISGRVFEDIAGDVLADGSIGDANNPGAVGVEVYLFRDEGNTVFDGSDILVAGPVLTDTSGNYAFTGLTDDTYFVRVDSRTLPSAQDPTAAVGDLWAVQTYASVGGWCAGGAGSATVQGSDGPCYGGVTGIMSDSASLPLHYIRVLLAGASAIGNDFGFSFNVVVNPRGGDGRDDDAAFNRTVQGSLRQFIQNANAIAGPNAMRFVPVDPANDGTWWEIAVSNALPTISDAQTSIDGAAIDLADGATLRDANADGPELEIDGSTASAADGLLLTSDGNELRALAIGGFGDPDQAGIRIDGVAAHSNRVIGNFIGTDGSGSAALANGTGVRIVSGAKDNQIGGNTTQERNVISGNGSVGVVISDAGTDGNRVLGNYIGTNFAGAGALANGSDGVSIVNSASNTTIGGTAPGAGNLVSGNGNAGIYVSGAGATGTVIQGNVVGLNAASDAVFGNGNDGIILDSATGVLVGGTVGNAGNVLSGNLDPGNESDGLWITGGGNHVVQGNFLGTNPAGDPGLGNFNAGVTLTGSSGNLIGGTAAGASNIIAHNGINGVLLYSGGTDNSILGNSIYGNGDLGIDLGRDGVTTNDPGDTDPGVNELRNFPVLTSATEETGTIEVDFTLDVPAGDYRIEFFRNPFGVDGSHGEGQLPISALTVVHGGGGIQSFAHSFAGSAGDTLTATATDSLVAGGYGSTSEFSAWIPVVLEMGNEISGIVFEDTNFDGTASPYDGGVVDRALANVDIELYNGTTDAYIASTTTAVDGSYSFEDLSDGDFKVRARAATIGDADTPPTGGLNPTVPATWPYPLAEMTWGAGAARMGGRSAAIDDTDTADDAGPGDTWLDVTVGGSEVTGVDFGFAYNLIVNTTDDGLIDSARSDQGSLRQFIKNANAIAGVTTSYFDIAAPRSAGFHTIAPLSGMPAITDRTILDASTEPDFATTPVIRLDGASAGVAVNGLSLADGSDKSEIRGMAIVRCTQDGLLVQVGADSVRIAGNWLGTDGTGAAGMGNGDDGIEVLGAAAIVGGTGAFDRNIINHNNDEGINLSGSSALGATIQGNYIGLEPDGSSGSGNRDVGIAILTGSSGHQIGGTTPAARNVISMNIEGIEVNTSDNHIEGNFIGTDATGTSGRGNHSDDGVEIQAGSRNVVGGRAVGAGNLIAFNAGHGVNVVTGSENAILGNIIHSNDLLGIDLANDGVSTNDPGDGDTGANDSQNYPTLSSAVTNGGTAISVAGTLNSVAATTYRIEFFASANGDASMFGEGERLLGFIDVTADASGNAPFSAPFSDAVAVGEHVTATATDPDGNTSEFAGNVIAQPPTLLVVDTTRDVVDGAITSVADLQIDPGLDGVISLREAITATNNSPNGPAPDVIHFAIPVGDPGYVAGGDYWSIQPTGQALPSISDPVILDGYSQPGASAGTQAFPSAMDAVLKIEINGSQLADSGEPGLTVSAGNSTLRGLAIRSFTGTGAHGLVIRTNGNNRIQGSFIGTDITGTVGAGNEGYAIFVDSPDNLVGGSLAGEGNLLSASDTYGVWIVGSRNRLEGNLIGTDITGTQDLGHSASGVGVISGTGIRIGGSASGSGNLISGNDGNGVWVNSSPDSLYVQGNRIGTDITGTLPLGNSSGGAVLNSPNTVFGGTGVSEGNLVSGNIGGVSIASLATNTVVEGNLLGTDISGTAILGNAGFGINVRTSGNRIGGIAPEARNVVSGNQIGITLSGPGASGNVVHGNYIGTDATGLVDLGNTSHAVRIESGASGNEIGGSQGGTRNLIAGNTGSGVWITGQGTRDNLIRGNWIGVDASGAVAMPNHTGVTIVDSASVNLIGGFSAGEGNLLSGNTWRGVLLDVGADSNRVEGNIVGLDAAGTVAVPNRIGIYLYQATNNTIGGILPGSGNTVSGHPDFGIYIVDALSTGNRIQGNVLGLDLTQTVAVPNGTSAVEIISAHGNLIGGLDPLAGNLITGNTGSGISLVGADPNDNAILSNSIYGNGALGIDLDRDGITANDSLDLDTGANDRLNFPVISSATATAGVVDVDFDLDVPAGFYRVEFFRNASGLDPSGYGEGEALAGALSLTHDGLGTQSFSHALAGVASDTLTATVTECSDGSCTSFGSSSEYSAIHPVIDAALGADLELAMSVDQAQPLENDRITYTVLVTNRGPTRATGARIADVLPSGLSFADATTTHGSYNQLNGRWSVGALMVDESASLSLEAMVDVGTTGTTITNTASVFQLNEPDNNASNDSASVAITVSRFPAGSFYALASQPEPGLVLPGAASQETFRLTLHNLTSEPETLSSLTLTNQASGPALQSQRDQEWGELSLHWMTDQVPSAMQAVGTPASFSTGTVTFDALSLDCAPGDSLVLVLMGGAALAAGDADVLDLEITDASALGFEAPVPLVGDWPLAPEGYFTVNGMVAAQVSLEPVGPGNLRVESFDNLALSIVLPPNGFVDDELSRLNIVDLGSATPIDDLAAMDAWADDGDGAFDSDIDLWLGEFSFTGDRWELTGLTHPVSQAGQRIFVSVDIASLAQEGRTIQLRLPTLPDVGVGMLSGNDGPLDAPLDNPFALAISAVDRVTMTTVGITADVTQPGTSGVVLLHLVATNSYSVPKRVNAISFQNASMGSGTQAQLDRQFQQLALRLDGDDDQLLGDLTQDPLVGSGVFSSGRVTIDGLNWDLPAGASLHAFLTANISLFESTDGDVLSAVVGEAADFTFEDVTAVTASWPLDSGSQWTVDGMVAAQITNHGAPVATVGPGDLSIPVLDLNLPANGYLNDELNAIRVMNLGTAADLSDIDQLRLWRDDGNGQFEGAGFDTDLGALSWDGSGWASAFLNETVATAGTRLFVGLDVAVSPTDSATVRLAIPVDGIVMASGNDGPIDEVLVNPHGQLISASPLLSTIRLAPSVSTLGRSVQAQMVVRNSGVEDVLGVTPSVLVPMGDGSLSVSLGPNPASFDLSVGEVDTFTWTLDAVQLGVVRLIGNAQGVGGTTSLTRESTSSESNQHVVLQEASELDLFVVGIMPTSANRDESEIAAFNLTFTNPGGPSGSDALLRHLRLSLEDDAGDPIVPSEVLSRVTVSEGSNVYLVKSSLETMGSDVDLSLAMPPRITTREPITVSISFDLVPDTTVPRFHMLLRDDTAVVAEDAVSGNPVLLNLEEGSYPLSSGYVNLMAGAVELQVTGTSPSTLRVEPGSIQVPLLEMDLENLDTGLLTSNVQLEGFSIDFLDSTGIVLSDVSPWIDRIRVEGPDHIHASYPVLGGSPYEFDLSPLLFLAAGTPRRVTIVADFRMDAPSGALRMRVPNPTSFRSTDSNTGDPVSTSFPAGAVVGATVYVEMPVDLAMVEGWGSLPATVTIGSTDLPTLGIAVRHPGGAGTARLRWSGVTLHVLDQSGDPIVPATVLSGLRVFRSGTLLASVPDPATSGGSVSFAWPDLLLAPGETATLDLVIDISTVAPATSLELRALESELLILDDNSGAPVEIEAEPGTLLPISSGVTLLQVPPTQLTVQLESKLPTVLAADGRERVAGGLVLKNSASVGSGPIELESLTLMSADREFVPLAVGRTASTLAVYHDGLLWAEVNGIAESQVEVTLTGVQHLRVLPGEPMELELRMTLTEQEDVESVRFGIAQDDVGVVQPQSALLQVEVMTTGGESFPLWTEAGTFSVVDFASSYANFPNPFAAGRENTTFVFYLDEPGRVTLTLWTARGEKVVTLLNSANRAVGLHQADIWDGRNGRGRVVINDVFMAELTVQYDSGRSERAVRKVAVVR